MTKEGLEKYARENRKRLDSQEVKIGDVVKVLVGQFAGETGIVIGIIACDKSDYTDPYYEIALNCEVPEKYKCRKTLITPNNVAGGFAAHDFEVIGNRAPKQPSMEIKQGDKVRIANNAPSEYRYGFNHRLRTQESEVVGLDDDGYMAAIVPMCVNDKDLWFQIPTKYLVKVDAEEKPKFRVGDWVKIKRVTAASLHELPDVYKNCPFKITAINGSMITAEGHEHSIYLPFHAFEPTEQSEEEERQEEFFKKQTESTLKSGEYFRKQTALAMTMNDFMESPFKMIPRTMFNTEFWVKYEADLAKEVALKVANKFNDPEQAAEYAVKVAKAVVEGLKRK